jgi:hypothetical protein
MKSLLSILLSVALMIPLSAAHAGEIKPFAA